MYPRAWAKKPIAIGTKGSADPACSTHGALSEVVAAGSCGEIRDYEWRQNSDYRRGKSAENLNRQQEPRARRQAEQHGPDR